MRVCPVCHHTMLGACCGCTPRLPPPRVDPERAAERSAAAARGRSSRAKGQRGERELADLLEAALGCRVEVRSAAQRHDGAADSDLVIPGSRLWIEAKRGRRVDWRAALRQAASAAAEHGGGRLPVVVARDDRDEAVVVLPWETWREVARAWLESLGLGGER